MNKILAQFRRLYDDKGSNDIDFSVQEEKLRVAQDNLADATRRLVKSSEILNAAALSSFTTKH